MIHLPDPVGFIRISGLATGTAAPALRPQCTVGGGMCPRVPRSRSRTLDAHAVRSRAGARGPSDLFKPDQLSDQKKFLMDLSITAYTRATSRRKAGIRRMPSPRVGPRQHQQPASRTSTACTVLHICRGLPYGMRTVQGLRCHPYGSGLRK